MPSETRHHPSRLFAYLHLDLKTPGQPLSFGLVWMIYLLEGLLQMPDSRARWLTRQGCKIIPQRFSTPKASTNDHVLRIKSFDPIESSYMAKNALD